MSDRLTLAVHAVRDTASGEEPGAVCFTRSRVLAGVRQLKQRRVLNLTFGIPLAAVLMGSVAWAASDHHFAVVVQYVSTALARGDAEHARRPSTPMPARRRPDPGATESPAHHQLSGPAVAPLDTALEAAPANSQARSAVAAAPAAHSGATALNSEVTEREFSLYESAHHWHFIDKNWVAALAGWDEYLRKVPRGRFAVEARYNRALCLVRLGRTDQARDALLAFAQGAAGEYRQKEARELIEQLASR